MSEPQSQPLRVEQTRLPGVLLIHPPTQFEDFRGNYIETYNEALYRAAGITDHWVQDDFSASSRHVLRGFHGDTKTTKLISCVYGKIYVIIVNNDPSSTHFRQWQSFTLSDQNHLQLYLPPRHGNSFLVMSDMALYHYKQSQYYDREGQFTIKWNDPAYKFWWPIRDPIVSERDSAE